MNDVKETIESIEKIIKENNIKEFNAITETIIGDNMYDVKIQYNFKKSIPTLLS